MALLTPEFLQTKTYSALRDRLAFQHGSAVQPGTWDMGDYLTTQRAASANMSVDVSAGFAMVLGNDPGNAGLYHVQNDATTNVPQAIAAHATLPRLDKLILLVSDTTHGGDASDAATLQWVTGTATAGTTLDNGNDGSHGAGALPTGSLLLADVLVPAAATTMTTANIRDRRTSARQGWFKIANAALSSTTLTFANLTLWGEVEHLRAVGHFRSTRAGFANTGFRFRLNAITSGYAIIGDVDSAASTPPAATTAQSWGLLGSVAAATSADLGMFELDLRYVNNVNNRAKYAHSTVVSYLSGVTQLINERCGNVLPSAFQTQRMTQLELMDDVGSVIDTNSHAELWVFGG